MNKGIVLGVLLALAGTAALAEWEDVGATDGFTVYVDRSTIRRSGSLVKMWRLLDYKTIQTSASGGSYLSSKSQREYDCKEELGRNRFTSWYSEKMGDGSLSRSDNNIGEWEPIPPDTVAERLWKIACGK